MLRFMNFKSKNHSNSYIDLFSQELGRPADEDLVVGMYKKQLDAYAAGEEVSYLNAFHSLLSK